MNLVALAMDENQDRATWFQLWWPPAPWGGQFLFGYWTDARRSRANALFRPGRSERWGGDAWPANRHSPSVRGRPQLPL